MAAAYEHLLASCSLVQVAPSPSSTLMALVATTSVRFTWQQRLKVINLKQNSVLSKLIEV